MSENIEETIFVDVRVNYVTRIIELTTDEAKNPSSIVPKIFAALKITSDTDTVDFSFRDNLGAPILASQLSGLIMQKRSSGSFFIELVFNKPPLSVRAESIKTFLQEKYPKECFFDETELFGGELTLKREKSLIDGLYTYIIETFPSKPPQDAIIECCKAVVQLFPYLETNPSDFGGIDKLYNPSSRKGKLFHKLRNEKTSTKSTARDNTEIVITQEELKSKLKYCVVKNEKEGLKNMLLQTVTLRRNLLKDQGQKLDDAAADNEFKQFWTFYFVDTDLILYDFQLLFDNIKSDSLEKKWDILHDKPLSHFKDKIDIAKVGTTDVKLWQLITLFMSLKPRGDIWKPLTSLIVFSKNPQDDPMKLLTGNQNPYIIAIIAANSKDLKYYVTVRGYLINIPEKFGVIGATDLVYKLHKIFAIEALQHIKRLINFLDYFVYANDDTGLDSGAIDKQMRELGERLLTISI